MLFGLLKTFGSPQHKPLGTCFAIWAHLSDRQNLVLTRTQKPCKQPTEKSAPSGWMSVVVCTVPRLVRWVHPQRGSRCSRGTGRKMVSTSQKSTARLWWMLVEPRHGKRYDTHSQMLKTTFDVSRVQLCNVQISACKCQLN